MVQVVFAVNEEITASRLNQATQGFKFLRRVTFAGSAGSAVGSGVTAVSCGTWTPGSGTAALFVRVCGPGGGGGSAAADNGKSSISGGGGGGGYSEKWILSGFGSSQVVKIGLGGQGGGGTDPVGGTAASSAFGSLLSAGPGAGGWRIVNVFSGTNASVGGLGGAGAGGDIDITGAQGAWGFIFNVTGESSQAAALSGRGGQSGFGGSGGPEVVGTSNGSAGRLFGGGGSGAGVILSAGTTTRVGGPGAPGFVVVDEYG